MNVAAATGTHLSPRRPYHFSLSTHGGEELKTLMLLPQIDCRQAMCAENTGEFAAVMDVMFEHMPDDILT